MKLNDLFEAKFSAANASFAMDKMVSYVSRKLGNKLIKIPGVEHFKNSKDTGFGYRYSVAGTTQMIRFNWSSQMSAGKTNEITSIDIFTGKRNPSFSIKTKGISIVRTLPAVVAVLLSPTLGSRKVFPVNAAEAITEQVTPIFEGRKIPLKLGKALDDFYGVQNEFTDADNDDVFKFGFTSGGIKLPPLSIAIFGGKKHYYIKPDKKDEANLKKFLTSKGFNVSAKYQSGVEILPSAITEQILKEAKRDDYTAEAALSDFFKRLQKGETLTRSDFIMSYHIVHAGMFDTIVRDFADQIEMAGKRVSLRDDTNVEKLKKDILAKAGVIEVTAGGADEVYLETKAEAEAAAKQGERIAYSDSLEHLEGLVTGIIKGAFNALFVAGKGGTGKTQTVERVLAQHGLSDGQGYFKNTGSASASGVYTLLYHERKNIILFDDSDGALADQDARNIIKAATDTKKKRKLVWNKKSSFIFDPDQEDPDAYEDDPSMAPKFFDFEGRIIFISNLPLNKLDPDGALRTRAFVITIDPTDEEMYEYMGKILHDIRLEDGLSLSTKEREHVLTVVKSSQRKGDTSLRKLVRALNLAASGAGNWEQLVKLYA